MFYGIFYTFLGHTALIGIFSKVLKAGPQGKAFGLFGSAGSLARVIFPLTAGILTDWYSDHTVFILACFVLIFTLIVYEVYKPHMIHLLTTD